MLDNCLKFYKLLQMLNDNMIFCFQYCTIYEHTLKSCLTLFEKIILKGLYLHYFGNKNKFFKCGPFGARN